MRYYGSDTFYDIVEFLFGLFRVSGTFTTVLKVVCYVFTGLSLYTIAKRRGIRKYGLAWVPIINVWILGSISDQYKYVTTGKTQGRRKILLCLSVLQALSSIIAVVYLAAKFFGFVLTDRSLDSAIFGLLGTAVVLVLLILVISIVYLVFYFISLYNVFMSCMPGDATLFLVLSIFFRVTTPFFLFACRNKDDGMPARFAQPDQEPEQNPYTEPWEN